ncbi:2-amino-4-hydroxy-6-hydroxymethyldihydropteridine diphosphokinase [Vreelandella massiliensis]|uniref:2-amino-4-hydroxy-6- hydroxymethyldihydropteridine diphosphokinase n=1 Tax=Vreelandella massiliensis TaxID=1816686 RepID=UPI00096A37B4|nr:2-amino-4-hydroxy-6-hydroxymethyldihydropteridine diphosphokinase [Halomonas massiliensis]MYL23226.1 2-amino-4-hydroxy-6-hydroxymethyldihydropteridine diphosphokinase [Halomonas alkaliantarctica]
MPQVTVSLGSNIDPVRHIRLCLDALDARFGALNISRIFESEPVGFDDSRNFFNLVVAFESDASPGELQAWAKRLEADCGRRPDTPKFSPRALDIDLLTVGGLCGDIEGVSLPRGEITRNAFVLQPLAELLPDDTHPLCGTPYATLWQRFDLGTQRLWAVDFRWRGRLISQADTPLALAAAR